MIIRSTRRALPALVTAVLLAVCTGPESADPADAAALSGGTDPGLSRFYGQRIGWAACPDDPRAPAGAGPTMQCATLTVPLDYTRPDGDVLDVAVVRYPAARRERRVGSLIVNAGGRSGSNVAMVRLDRHSFDGPLHERFDIIGFDPRGVGGTTPVKCLDDRAHDTQFTADGPADERTRTLADACRARYAPVLPFLGTRNTARDMDVLRATLGERTLNYFGLSSGTYLGILYAEQFPHRLGRVVLDGASSPSVPPTDSTVARQVGLEQALSSFAADCTTLGACPLGTDPGQAARKLASYLDGLTDHPLTTSSGRALTANAAWTAVLTTLTNGHQDWPRLRDALDWAMVHGRGDDLLDIADAANGRNAQGRYNGYADAPTAIACADSAANSPTPEQLQSALADLAAKAPLTSRHAPQQAALDPDCRSWPYHSPEQPHPARPATDTTILVVGSTADPITPYAATRQLTAELGNASLLTRGGDGNTAYGRSTCIRTAVDTFLTQGTLPAPGKGCPSD
ncbi:alpha/beta hydrolase [Kitasatospora sp. NPDC001159]